MDLDATGTSEKQPNDSPTFGRDGSFHVKEAVGSASISPSGRDIALGSPEGLHIIDLDNPWSPPRNLSHRQPWEVADVQWSPFASRDYLVASTSNQKALVWNLNMPSARASIEHVLHGHSRAITDINFSAHDPDMLATCSIDSFVHCWDLRHPNRPAMTFADWYAGASQVKWNRQDPHILASSHDRYLHIWDDRKGAVPLRTVVAHSTKIYGIDWNRTDATRILTCSLDKSIKVWNYEDDALEPLHVIRTTYPVWRARHTPFGHGILAMPQHGGNNALHLYDVPQHQENAEATPAKPLHTFAGHREQVKEFLWRSQGTANDIIDNRDYQLVSWGTDNDLLLYRVEEAVMKSIGYFKGQSNNGRIRFTRKGATYKTFHVPPSVKAVEKHGLATLFKDRANHGIRVHIKATNTSEGSKMENHHPGLKKQTDPISWMRGVKIGASVTEASNLPDLITLKAPPWTTKESLGDEIASVGNKYKTVTFEEVKVPERHATFSLTGPWGPEAASAHMRVHIAFPDEYPSLATPEITVQNTSSLSDAALRRLSLEARTMCDAYGDIGRGSLEALVCYLLGEWDVSDALAYCEALQDILKTSLERLRSAESSDEENDPFPPPSPAMLFDQSASEIGSTRIADAGANANVPLPKACGALWASDGRLICFFPQRNESGVLFSTSTVGSAQQKHGARHPFQTFGHFIGSGARISPTSIDSDSDDDSSHSSSFSISLSSDDSDLAESSEAQKSGWQGSKSHISDSRYGDRSSARVLQSRRSAAPQQTVSLQDHDDLTPSRRRLAEEYIVFGSSHEVCSHNSETASKYGLQDLADVWEFLGHILRVNLPLRAVKHPVKANIDVLIIVRLALVSIRRKDSSLDYAFDCPDEVENPEFWGRTHAMSMDPWGARELVMQIIHYYEAIADVQMLGMLSCVLSHQAMNEEDMDTRSVCKPRVMKSTLDWTPGSTYEYWNTEEEMISVLDPPQMASDSPNPGNARLDREQSFDSDTAIWSNNDVETQRGTRYPHTQLSPPGSTAMTRQGSHASGGSHEYDSSPEATIKRSASMLSTRLAASFSRPFSFMTSSSASPPAQSRTPELSTSAPLAGHDTNFGRSKTFDDAGSLYRVESRSSLAHEVDAESLPDVGSDNDSEEEVEPAMTVHAVEDYMTKQHVSLLQTLGGLDNYYVAWREAYAHMLFVWQLPLKRAEVLEFNDARDLESSGPTMDAQQTVTNIGRRENLYCSICYEVVAGTYTSCLECGHACHSQCEDALAAICREDLDCAIGCGCSCFGGSSSDDADQTSLPS